MTRRTFSTKNSIEYDFPLPCVCQNTPSRPNSGCARSTSGSFTTADTGAGATASSVPFGSGNANSTTRCASRFSSGNSFFNSSCRATDRTARSTPST